MSAETHGANCCLKDVKRKKLSNSATKKQINESKFGKRKTNCGRRVGGVKVVGGVDNSPHRIFLLLSYKIEALKKL